MGRYPDEGDLTGEVLGTERGKEKEALAGGLEADRDLEKVD